MGIPDTKPPHLPRLRFFGGAHFEGGAGDAAALASRRHAVALLAALATAPSRALGRSRLAGLLWPDCPEQTARNRLSTCVHQVRSALGDGALRSRGDLLELALEHVRCDLCTFEDALAVNDPARAVDCYLGPLLDGVPLPNSTEIEQYLGAQRERLAQAYCGALEALAGSAQQAGRSDEALEWWRRRAAVDRCDARITMRWMEALFATGNRAEALRVAREHGRMLQQEFGVLPDAAVEALARRLAELPTGTAGATAPPRRDESRRADTNGHGLAVLPFVNLSRSDEIDPFAAGLHDDLLTELSRVPGLTVIARTSVLRYRGTTLPVQVIGRELDVAALLEGALQHAGGRLRLNVQLIDARTGAHRWAERFDRALSTDSLFDIQTELVERIASSLRDAMAPPPASLPGRSGAATADLEAYRLHALGRQQLGQLTDSSVRLAVAQFRRAIARDPGFALAWTGLADALTTLDDYNYETSDAALLAEARAATRHALSLAPDLPEALASLGKLDGMERNGPESVRALQRAVALRPGYAQAHDWLSWMYQCLGRPQEALASATRAVELDPLLPEAVSNLSAAQLGTGQAERALQEARSLQELSPGWPTASFYEALALYRLGRFEEARDLLDGLSVPWSGPGAPCTLALACAGAGDRDRARAVLAAFEQQEEHFAAGLVRLALGETEQAFGSFERVLDWGAYWPTLAVQLYFPALWEPLQTDPRFRRILQRVRHAWGVAEDDPAIMPA